MKDLFLKSEYDGLMIGVSISEPEYDPVGIIQIAHGMSEHRKRYFEMMDYFSDNGYVVIINDHRGHGESIRDRSELGWFESEGLLKDMLQINKYIRAEYPGVPLYLFGHSMGSLAVRCYAKRWDDTIDGMFIAGSPSYNPAASPGRYLVKTCMLFQNDKHVNNFITGLVSGSFSKKFNVETGSFVWLNSDKREQKKYENDPLCGFPFTLKGNLSLLRLMCETYSRSGWKVSRSDIPVAFFSGSDDPCMINEQKLADAVELMKKVGYKNVSVKTYPGLRHELMMERDHRLFFVDMLNIIK